jgi:hypothetical protein
MKGSFVSSLQTRTWAPALDASQTLKIIEMDEKWESYHPPKYVGLGIQKCWPQNITKPVPKHPKKNLDIALLLLEFKDDLYNLRWCSYRTFKSFKMKKNEKVISFENNKGWNTRKMSFISWNFFVSHYFFLTPFHLDPKDDL